MKKLTKQAHIQKLNKRRKRHRVLFFVAYCISFTSLIGILFTTYSASGTSANIMFSLAVGQEQPPVISHPSQPNPGGAGSPDNFPQITPAPVPEPNQTDEDTPLVAPPDVQQTEVVIDLFLSDDDTKIGDTVTNQSAQGSIPHIAETQPIFSGSVGVPRALIFLEVHSGQVLTTTITADAHGKWHWQVPEKLTIGLHTLFITVFDPTGFIKLASGKMKFEVIAEKQTPTDTTPKKPAGQVKPRTEQYIPTSVLLQRTVLFDIRVKVLSEKQLGDVHPGDDLFATIALINIGSPGYLVDANVNYKIFTQAGEDILNENETIAVATQASYLKRFSLSPKIKPGQYTIETSVSYGDTKAFSSDDFIVVGEARAPFAGNTTIDISTLIFILIIVFSLAIVIVYFEHHMLELLGDKMKQITEDDLQKQGLIK